MGVGSEFAEKKVIGSWGCDGTENCQQQKDIRAIQSVLCVMRTWGGERERERENSCHIDSSQGMGFRKAAPVLRKTEKIRLLS
jgi:hypothetical protein